MEHKQHEKNEEGAQENPEAPRDHYLDGDPEKDAETLARVGPEDTVFVRGRISTDIEAIDDLTCARLYVHSRVTVDGLYNTQIDHLSVSGVVQDVYGLSGNSTVSPDKDLTASGRHRAFVKITEYGLIRSLVNSAVSSLAGTGGAGATARVVEINDCQHTPRPTSGSRGRPSCARPGAHATPICWPVSWISGRATHPWSTAMERPSPEHCAPRAATCRQVHVGAACSPDSTLILIG